MTEGILLDDLCGEDNATVIVSGTTIEAENGTGRVRLRGAAGDKCLLWARSERVFIVEVQHGNVVLK